MRRGLCIVLICFSLFLPGCENSRQIETASIIENVTIGEEDGQVIYTFYTITSSDKPWGIKVPASSFEEACQLAENEFIPNLSLSKLELLMIDERLIDSALKTDIEYISTQPSFSPMAYVTLCDGKTIEKFDDSARNQKLIEEQLILIKKNDPEVNINYLSVFNNFASDKSKEFKVGMIECAQELKISEKKIIKNEK